MAHRSANVVIRTPHSFTSLHNASDERRSEYCRPGVSSSGHGGFLSWAWTNCKETNEKNTSALRMLGQRWETERLLKPRSSTRRTNVCLSSILRPRLWGFLACISRPVQISRLLMLWTSWSTGIRTQRQGSALSQLSFCCFAPFYTKQIQWRNLARKEQSTSWRDRVRAEIFYSCASVPDRLVRDTHWPWVVHW